MDPDPPKLDYATPDPSARPRPNYAGCLLPIAFATVALGLFILYTVGLYSRWQKPEIRTRGMLITALGVVVFALWYFVRRRR